MRAMKMLASAAVVVTGVVFAAAHRAPEASAAKNTLPVVFIQEVETDSAQSYAMWVAENNREAKSKAGAETFVKVFQGETAGPDSGKTFAVISGESFAMVVETQQKLENEPAIVKNRVPMSQIRKLGPQVALKAVRWDGRNEVSFVSNTRVTLTDEAGYLNALGELRSLMDAHDLKDIKVNCSRVVSGKTDYTHLVSLNAPSAERRAVLMDAIASEPWALEWIAAAAKYRTVVSNGTFKEITR